MILKNTICEKIDQYLKKFPSDKKASGVLAALRWVQADNGGYLTTELMDAVAHYLSMPCIAVYEIASFYTLFDVKPVGKYKISVCGSVPCYLKNSDQVLNHLQNKLNIKVGETTPDKRFTLKQVECLAACGGAPVFQIDDRYYENMSIEQMNEILDNLA